MKYQEIENVILKNGLEFVTKRHISLLSISCIAHGYVKKLKKEIGFSNEIICSYGEKGYLFTLLNEKVIASKTEKYLAKDKKRVNLLIDKADRLFKDFIKSNNLLEKEINTDPKKYLEFVINKYPDYMLGVALINLFWRYIGNNKAVKYLNKKDTKKIIKIREQGARIYPIVEKYLNQSCSNLKNTPYRYIKHMTISEARSLLKNRNISKKLINTISNRKVKYFYIYNLNNEIVITDKKLLKQIQTNFFKKEKRNIKKIKGLSVHRGIIKGYVIKKVSNKDNKGKVLVTHMTNPDDTLHLKGISAIITDEGGILSHASVVAREFKIPTIIGTRIATQVLKQGDKVVVNANNGIITKL